MRFVCLCQAKVRVTACVSGGFGDNENNSLDLWVEGDTLQRWWSRKVSLKLDQVLCAVLQLYNTPSQHRITHVTPPRQVCSTYADVHPDLICLHVFGKEVFNTWRERAIR